MNYLNNVRNINKSISNINDSLKVIFKNQDVLQGSVQDIFQCSKDICSYLAIVCLNLENICKSVYPIIHPIPILESIEKIKESMKNVSNLVRTIFLTLASNIVYSNNFQQVILAIKNILESNLKIYDSLMGMIEFLEL